jgi:hypothetical protein
VVVAWVVVFALLVGAGAGAVLILNATVFGAAGFVRVYLEAIARGDAESALAMPGVSVDPALRDDFLVDDALAGVTDLREISVERTGGVEVVTFAWAAGGVESVSSFTVERTGSRLGLFPDWAFAQSPIAALELTVENDARFDLNGVAASSGIAAADPVAYAVLVPGVYRAAHVSTYLRARSVDAVAGIPGAPVEATLVVLPTEALRDEVTAQVHEHLTACATQEVLFPTGCALGRAIANRVVSTPEWSIVEYPDLSLEPGGAFGTWLVPPADGVAHLVVDVQSLFDGSVTTLDEDVPFAASYVVTIGADDATLRIVPQV